MGLISALIIGLSPDIVRVLLGKKWVAAGPLMQWLAVWGASRALGQANSSLFHAVGRPNLSVIFQAVMLVMFGAAVFPMTWRYGLWGVGVSLAITGAVTQVLRYPLTAKILKMSVSHMYVRTGIPLSAAVAAVGVCFALRSAMADVWIYARLVTCAAACVGTYAGVLLIWDRFGAYQLVPTVLDLLPERFRRKVAVA